MKEAVDATEKLYDGDAYGIVFSATVRSCRQRDGRILAVLDRTAFFPEAGGQTPDRGFLWETAGEPGGGEPDGVEPAGAARVLDVQIDDATGVITHTLDREIPAGSAVTGRIDWKHRFDNMQQHSGEHIFSGLVCGRYGCDNVGFHLSEQTVTMDYNRALSAEELAEIERLANEAIWRDLPVEVSYPPDEALSGMEYRSKKELAGQIRIVTIPGIDVCACCAPHVRRTGEIGLLKVLAAQSYKGGVRVTIACGGRALAQLTETYDLLTGMARAFSTAPEEVPGQVDRLKRELSESKRHAAALAEKNLARLLELDAGERCNKNLTTSDMITSDSITGGVIKDNIITNDTGLRLLFDPAADAAAARRVLNRWAEGHAGLCGIFLGDDAAGYQYLIAAGRRTAGAAAGQPDGGARQGSADGEKAADARGPAKLLMERCGAKGGGSPEMTQGRVAATEREIRAALAVC